MVRRRRILFILTGGRVVRLDGLLFAGNYFGGEGVKRTREVELHREAEEVNVDASEEDQILLAEAEAWYEQQHPDLIELTSFDDLRLKAKFIKKDSSTNKAVILAHG